MRSLLWKLVLVALTVALAAAPVPRQPAAWAAAPALEEAQSLYDGAQFKEAIAKIRDALATGQVLGADAFEARVLLARCLVKSGDRLAAKQAFKFVLRQQPGWRPDANVVPPDEQEVFALAQQELTAEQISAGKRIPASISFSWGRGAGENKDMAEIAVAGNGSDKYDVKPQLGGSVRFPIANKLSLDLELQQLRAKDHDAIAEPNTAHYEITAYPVSLSLYHSTFSTGRARLNLFAGAGLLSSAISKIDLHLNFGSGDVPVSISGQKTGAYFHGGLEGEFLVHPRIAVTGRVMERYAKANKVLDEYGFSAYGSASLKNRSIDFSGFAATLGLRAYIGY